MGGGINTRIMVKLKEKDRPIGKVEKKKKKVKKFWFSDIIDFIMHLFP